MMADENTPKEATVTDGGAPQAPATETRAPRGARGGRSGGGGDNRGGGGRGRSNDRRPQQEEDDGTI